MTIQPGSSTPPETHSAVAQWQTLHLRRATSHQEEDTEEDTLDFGPSLPGSSGYSSHSHSEDDYTSHSDGTTLTDSETNGSTPADSEESDSGTNRFADTRANSVQKIASALLSYTSPVTHEEEAEQPDYLIGKKRGRPTASTGSHPATTVSVTLESEEGTPYITLTVDEHDFPSKRFSHRYTTTVDLSSTPVDAEMASTLAKHIIKNGVLTKLNLSNNKIGGLNLYAITQALGKNRTLKELNLSNNNLGSAGMYFFQEALRKNTTLRSLDLGYNDLGPQGAQHLANLVQRNKGLRLTTLNLPGNNIGSLGADKLGIALSSQTSPLTHLGLAKNNIGLLTGESNDIPLKNGLITAIQINPKLASLDISCNGLFEAATLSLADALTRAIALTHLNLKGIRITDPAAEALGEMLIDNRTIQSLDLAGTSLTDAGVRHLIEGLSNSIYQREISLLNNTRVSPEVMQEFDRIAQARVIPLSQPSSSFTLPPPPSWVVNLHTSDEEPPQGAQGTTPFTSPSKNELILSHYPH